MRFSVRIGASGIHELASHVISSSCAFPATSLGFTVLGEIFAYETVFFFFFFFLNPTIEVTTFRLRGCAPVATLPSVWLCRIRAGAG